MSEDHLQISVEGEFDFDREIDGLRSQVGRLKHVTRSIHTEAQDQNKFLEQMVSKHPVSSLLIVFTSLR